MTEGAILLRPARAFDAAGCAAIVNDWIDTTPWLPRRRTRPEIARMYREVMIPCRRVTVAEAAGEVAGFLALDPASGEVASLFVGPKGRGIGAALMADAKATRALLWLWTFQANAAARRFYLRQGFAEADRTEGENDEGLPDVQYVWTAP